MLKVFFLKSIAILSYKHEGNLIMFHEKGKKKHWLICWISKSPDIGISISQALLLIPISFWKTFPFYYFALLNNVIKKFDYSKIFQTHLLSILFSFFWLNKDVYLCLSTSPFSFFSFCPTIHFRSSLLGLITN